MINHIPLANVGLTNSINSQLSISDQLHLCPIMPTQWSMPESWDALKMVTDHWEYGIYCILVKYSLNNRSLALTAYIVLTFKASSNHELLMSHKLVWILRVEARTGKLWSNAFVILSLSQIYWLWEFYRILSSIHGYKVCLYTRGVVCIQVLRVMRHEKLLIFIFHVSVNMTKCTGGDLILYQQLRHLKYRSTFNFSMRMNYGFIKQILWTY